MSTSIHNVIANQNKNLLCLILFTISLIISILSLIASEQPYYASTTEFGLVAFIPLAFWLGFFIMIVCTAFSIKQAKSGPSQTLIMIMLLAWTLSLILPQASTLPIRPDSYSWMRLVDMTLLSGTTANPNQYMRWPIFWVFGAENMAVSGLGSFNLFRFAPSLFSFLAPLYFYMVSRQLLGGIKAPLYASLLLALATAQEHLCPALLGSFLLLFSVYLLARSVNTKHKTKFVSLLVVAALTLAMEHHLSSLVLASLAVSFVVVKFLSERTKIIRQSPTYSIVLVSFLCVCWIAWMSFADVNFLAMPFQSILSLGPVTWISRPVTLTGMSDVHVGSAFVFRGIIYPAALIGFVFLIKEKRRLTEIAGWLLTTLIAMLASQLVFGGRFPFEPLRFEFFAFFPLLMLAGYSIYHIQAKYCNTKGLLIVSILLISLVLSNQIYRGTNAYTEQFFPQDESMSTWIDCSTVRPTVLITDYRLESFLIYASNSNVVNILGRNEILELFTDRNVSLIVSNIDKVHELSWEHNASVIYLVVDSIQLYLEGNNQPYSNEATDRFNQIPSLNKIYDNGKLVAYSSEKGK